MGYFPRLNAFISILFTMLQHFFPLSSAVLFSNLSLPESEPTPNEIETLPGFLERTTFLLDDLMINYRPELPAVFTKTRALDRTYSGPQMKQKFKVTMMYGKLLSVNEAEQSATMLVEVYLHWTDFRLTWNPKDYQGIKVLLINHKRLWIPDILPVDLINYRNNIDIERQNCLVAHNGSLVLFNSAVLTFNCEIKASEFVLPTSCQAWSFPFDIQECRVKTASRNFLTSEIDLESTIYERFSTDEMDIYGWEYPVTSLVFRMKRNSTYYVAAMIVPSFMLTVLVMFGIFWSPVTEKNYMERLSLGFAGKLALLVAATGEHGLPRSKEIPILSFYVLASLSLMSCAIGAALIMVKWGPKMTGRREEILVSAKGLKASLGQVEKPFLRSLSCESHTFCLILFILASLSNLLFLFFRGQHLNE